MDELLKYMDLQGFKPPEIVPDSKIHRFSRTGGQDKDSWYVCHQWNARDGSIQYTIVFSDWHKDEIFKFSTFGGTTTEDVKHRDKQFEKSIKEAEKQRHSDYEECRKFSSEYISKLKPGPHPYLFEKGIADSRFALVDGDKLIIPVEDIKGTIHGFQIIDAYFKKRFKLHTQKKGNFFRIPGSSEVFLVEGFATGVTVHNTTGATVIVCFDAGNIASVRPLFPNSILAGDNDEAGHKAGSGLFPPIEGKGNNDWNDYQRVAGIEAVKALLVQSPADELRPLGFKNKTYYYWSTDNKQIIDLEASSHTENNFYNLQTKAYWQTNFPAKDKGIAFKDAAAYLMASARRKGIFNPKNVRGSGVWLDNELVVNCGNTVYPRLPKSKYNYISSIPLPAPSEESDPNILLNILDSLSWKYPEHARLLAGWLCVAPFCGAIQWRPHLWLTGKAGSGKSTVLEQIVSPVLGDYKISVKSSSTEAGIRQTLGHNAIPVIFDEFEQFGDKDDKKMAVMDLFRQASIESSGEIVKGSSSGDSIQYSARFCGMVCSIGVSLNNESDRGRFSVIDLVKPTDEQRANYRDIEKSFKLLTPEYSIGLFTYTYNRFRTLNSYIQILWDLLNQEHGARFAQQYSALLAGYCLFAGIEPTPAFLEYFKFYDSIPDEKNDADEYICLNQLLFNLIDDNYGKRYSIKELIDSHEHKTLERHGVKLTDEALYVVQKGPMIQKLFQGSKWSGGGWSKSLSRLPGAINSVKKHIQNKTMSCVEIPIKNINESE